MVRGGGGEYRVHQPRRQPQERAREHEVSELYLDQVGVVGFDVREEPSAVPRAERGDEETRGAADQPGAHRSLPTDAIGHQTGEELRESFEEGVRAGEEIALATAHAQTVPGPRRHETPRHARLEVRAETGDAHHDETFMGEGRARERTPRGLVERRVARAVPGNLRRRLRVASRRRRRARARETFRLVVVVARVVHELPKPPAASGHGDATVSRARAEMGVPQRFAKRDEGDGDADERERELREERRSGVSLAETRADARGVPIVRGVATRLRAADRGDARGAARAREIFGGGGGVGGGGRGPRARYVASLEAAVDLGEDGDRGVADRLAEAGGETARGGAAQVEGDEDHAGPHETLLHAEERGGGHDGGPTALVRGSGQDHERGDEADDPAEDGDALAPVSVREAADDEAAYRLEHGEGHEETRLAAVGGLRELPARTVQHRQLVEL